MAGWLAVLMTLAAMATMAGTAFADTYKIIDERGRVQYTDRVPPEAVNRGMVELNKQGMAKKVTEPPPTPEQLKAIEAAAEKKKQAEKEAARQRAVEDALLQSYTTEADIDVAKRRNLAIVGASILSAEARIKSLERRSAALEKEKQFYENKPIPEKLKREIATVTAEIPKQYQLIEAKNREALAIETKYSEQKARFHEIKARASNDTPPKKP